MLGTVLHVAIRVVVGSQMIQSNGIDRLSRVVVLYYHKNAGQQERNRG